MVLSANSEREGQVKSHLTDGMFVFTVWLTSTRSGELRPVLQVSTPVPPSTTLKKRTAHVYGLFMNFNCTHLTGGSLTMSVFISSWLLDKGKHSKVRINSSDNSFSIVFCLFDVLIS